VAIAEQPGTFYADEQLNVLSAAGDPLERLRAVVDFELFRPDLEGAVPLLAMLEFEDAARKSSCIPRGRMP
jgi:hypothetical protein